MMMFLWQLLVLPKYLLALIAVIPAIILLVKVYKEDKLERESPRLIVSLLLWGILSTTIALLLEMFGEWVLNKSFVEENVVYNLILYFLIVGLSEEGAKYLLLRIRTWKDREFNCLYDAIVYSVTVSLGFALWENLSYVFRAAIYGNAISTALLRAITAVPGHASFGVIMGIFYGKAKEYSNKRDKKKSIIFEILSVLLPLLVHGLYDFIATYENVYGYIGTIVFFVFIVLLFVFSWKMIKKTSREDKFI